MLLPSMTMSFTVGSSSAGSGAYHIRLQYTALSPKIQSPFSPAGGGSRGCYDQKTAVFRGYFSPFPLFKRILVCYTVRCICVWIFTLTKEECFDNGFDHKDFWHLQRP